MLKVRFDTNNRNEMTALMKNLSSKGYYIGYINGEKCLNLTAFLSEAGLAFKFPDYYGNNVNAFLECINDLNWLRESNYGIVISNADVFLSGDSIENKEYVFKLLEGISEEWSKVPN